jgi:orotate phosphoribosyltransferase-like protein
MASAVENTTNVDAKLLKRLSRMYETGISLYDISEDLRIDEKTARMLLKLLGYASAD